jgi:Spy/CpxP family protein refolding chaperone
MREHIKAFLLASSLAFGIPAFVEAEPLEQTPAGADEMRAMRWLQKLDLTEAQRDQIFEILHEASARSDVALMRAETLSRVAAVLSPEQREKLALFRSQ